MFTLNQITLVGFTGSEAEVHHPQNGTVVAVVSVATKESWKDAAGEWQSRTDWHRVVSFGKLAEYTRTLAKGSYVMVQVRFARASSSVTRLATGSLKYVPIP